VFCTFARNRRTTSTCTWWHTSSAENEMFYLPVNTSNLHRNRIKFLAPALHKRRARNTGGGNNDHTLPAILLRVFLRFACAGRSFDYRNERASLVKFLNFAAHQLNLAAHQLTNWLARMLPTHEPHFTSFTLWWTDIAPPTNAGRRAKAHHATEG